MSSIEQWKDIIGYEGLYQVSNLGRVKRLAGKRVKQERFIVTSNNGLNYLFYNLWKNNKVKKAYVHRLIAEAFIDNPENKRCVDHKDFNPLNNSIDNLQWATQSENVHKQRREKSKKSLCPGVYWCKQTKNWLVKIVKNEKTYFAGRFNLEKEAFEAYSNLAKKLYGSFADLNRMENNCV